MKQEVSDSRLDYHEFLYEQLTAQLAAIQKQASENHITSFESLQENQLVRDSLLLKFIFLQRTLSKVGIRVLQDYYKMNLKPFPWLDAEYFDYNCVVHYDCVWSMLQDLKRLKKQVDRIKKYGENARAGWGEDVRCSFCGKSHYETERMIAGEHEAICSDCVKLCMEILEEVSANR